jgi:glycosyltransferase involved in cell wall biosynthesis
MTRPLRVAITLEQCWHAVPGGTATAALEPLRSMVRPGGPGQGRVEPVGVSARHGAPPPEPWAPPVPVLQLPLPRPALYEAWHQLRWPPVERATGPVDVTHATGMAVPATSAPLVCTLHDVAFLRDPGRSTRWGLRFFQRAVQLTRRHAALVVVPSQATYDDCVLAGFDPRRLRTVPLGVEVVEATPAEVAEVRARHGLDRPYVLWVGTIEPRKNLPVLVDAFVALDRPDLDLVLAGPSGWGEDLGPRLAPLGDRVRTPGFVPATDLRALYAGAELLCFPSRHEGFGLPVLEAMAQGTPVVTSVGTSTAEVAGGAAVLVEPASPAAVADGMRQVLDDPAATGRLVAAGRRRAAELSWDRCAEGLLAVYDEAADRGAGR